MSLKQYNCHKLLTMDVAINMYLSLYLLFANKVHLTYRSHQIHAKILSWLSTTYRGRSSSVS